MEEIYTLTIRYDAFREAGKEWPESYPRHYIYHQNTQTLYQYNYKKETTKSRTIRTTKDFYSKWDSNNKTIEMKVKLLLLCLVLLVQIKKQVEKWPSLWKGGRRMFLLRL